MINSINFAAAACLPSGVVLRKNISLAVYRGDRRTVTHHAGVRSYFPYSANILRY